MIRKVVCIVRYLIRREFEESSTQTRVVPCVFGGAVRFRIEVSFLDLPLTGEGSSVPVSRFGRERLALLLRDARAVRAALHMPESVAAAG